VIHSLLSDYEEFVPPPVLGELGGDCLCGRGPALGTCHWTDGRLNFRAFHNGPAVYHLVNVVDWACVDCIADAALAIASGKVREGMRRLGQERRTAPGEMS
jgi:hypothetical protein